MNPIPFFWGAKMSSDLQILLEKTKKLLSGTEEPPQVSEAQFALLNRVQTRRWKMWALQELGFLIEEIDAELGFIEHVENCKQCKLCLLLDVERYGGAHSPWYLDLQNDVGPIYVNCPQTEDYEFGNYWDRTEGKAMPFIKARLSWAKKAINKEWAASIALVKYIENYPVETGIPEEDLMEMITNIAGIIKPIEEWPELC